MVAQRLFLISQNDFASTFASTLRVLTVSRSISRCHAACIARIKWSRGNFAVVTRFEVAPKLVENKITVSRRNFAGDRGAILPPVLALVSRSTVACFFAKKIPLFCEGYFAIFAYMLFCLYYYYYYILFLLILFFALFCSQALQVFFALLLFALYLRMFLYFAKTLCCFALQVAQ